MGYWYSSIAFFFSYFFFIERVIWIGYYKGYQDGCPLSYLPRDLIRVIITLCRETLEEVAKIFSLESLFESIRPSIASNK